jgi:predicted DNA-binding transcriptional regulator AlpA
MTDLMTTKQLIEYLPISASTFYKLRRDDDFFPPLKLSARRIVWRRTDADAWLASR